MTVIDSNSYLTITVDYVKDNSLDCFKLYKDRQYVSIDFYTSDNMDRQIFTFSELHEKKVHRKLCLDLHYEPLSQHAWTLQERLLTERILHFCTDQMYYKCHQEFISEDSFCYRGLDKHGHDDYNLMKIHKTVQTPLSNRTVYS